MTVHDFIKKWRKKPDLESCMEFLDWLVMRLQETTIYKASPEWTRKVVLECSADCHTFVDSTTYHSESMHKFELIGHKAFRTYIPQVIDKATVAVIWSMFNWSVEEDEGVEGEVVEVDMYIDKERLVEVHSPT